MSLKKTILEDLERGKTLVAKAWWHKPTHEQLVIASVLDSDEIQAKYLANGSGYCPVTSVMHGETVDAFRNVIRSYIKYCSGSVPGWNDTPGRTKAEVLQLFDDASAWVEKTYPDDY